MAWTRKDLEEFMNFTKKNDLMDKPFEEVLNIYLKKKTVNNPTKPKQQMKASELKAGQIGKWDKLLIGKIECGKYVVELNGQCKVTSSLPIDVEVTLVNDKKSTKMKKFLVILVMSIISMAGTTWATQVVKTVDLQKA